MSDEYDRTDRLKLKLGVILTPEGRYMEISVHAQPYLLPVLDEILAGEPNELWGPTGQPVSAEELLHYIVGNVSVNWQALPVPAIDIKARHN